MSESKATGTPREYTDDLYRVYFEVGEHGTFARDVLQKFLSRRSHGLPGLSFSAESIQQHSHGYEVQVPLQLVPEIVAELSRENVAVYQVVRISKL